MVCLRLVCLLLVLFVMHSFIERCFLITSCRRSSRWQLCGGGGGPRCSSTCVFFLSVRMGAAGFVHFLSVSVWRSCTCCSCAGRSGALRPALGFGDSASYHLAPSFLPACPTAACSLQKLFPCPVLPDLCQHNFLAKRLLFLWQSREL